MHVQLFSSSPVTVQLWRDACRRIQVDMQSFECTSSLMTAPCLQSKVLIFDQVTLGNDHQQTAQLFKTQTQNAIGVTCSKSSVEYAVQHMRMGAEWIFPEPQVSAALDVGLACLLEVAERRNLVFQEFLKLQSLAAAITPREWEVVNLVLDGQPNKNIAKRLNISVRTVEARRTKVYRKFGVLNVTGLIRCVDRTAELRSQFQHVVHQAMKATKPPRMLALESSTTEHLASAVY